MTTAERKLRDAQDEWVKAKIEWSMAQVAIASAKTKWENAQKEFFSDGLVQYLQIKGGN